MMNLQELGKNTLEVEITNISSHSLWLLTKESELFLSYESFPWFLNAPINHLLNVEEISKNHFFWEDLDVDLTLDMIEHPENYPLSAKSA